MDGVSMKREYLPRLIFWESTVACNLTCQHCRRIEFAAQAELSTERMQRLFAELAELSRPIVVFSGGEPLMRADILPLARYAVDLGLRVALATNGTLLDADTAAAVAAAGIARVSISLDGATAATHDTFRRQEGSFARAIAGCGHLKTAGVPFQINTTVTTANEAELEALFTLAETLGAVALHLFLLVPVGCGAELAADQMLTPARYEKVLHWFYRRSQESKLETKVTCAPHYYRILKQRGAMPAGHPGAKPGGHPGTKPGGHPGGMNAVTRGCLAGTGVAFISHTGEVFPCGYLPVSCGNIMTQSFTDIWRGSPVFQELRDTGKLKGKCHGCDFVGVCGGCRARAYAGGGDYLAPEPYCLYTPPAVQAE